MHSMGILPCVYKHTLERVACFAFVFTAAECDTVPLFFWSMLQFPSPCKYFSPLRQGCVSACTFLNQTPPLKRVRLEGQTMVFIPTCGLGKHLKTVLVKLIFRKTLSPSATNTKHFSWRWGGGLESISSLKNVEKFLEKRGRKASLCSPLLMLWGRCKGGTTDFCSESSSEQRQV